MIEAVVIGHNEGAFLPLMARKLSLYNAHYVFDRPDDDSVSIAESMGLDYKVITEGEPGIRRTCTARNTGLSMCGDESDVLFLDGDRYPVYLNEELLASELSVSDVLLLRVERNDERDTSMVKRLAGSFGNMFYTPGVIFTRRAINAIRAYQGKLWEESVQDIWGVEDTYMGDVVAYLGLNTAVSEAVMLRGELNKRPLSDEAMLVRLRMREKMGYIC